jgi:hypothetical protein
MDRLVSWLLMRLLKGIPAVLARPLGARRNAERQM